MYRNNFYINSLLNFNNNSHSKFISESLVRLLPTPLDNEAIENALSTLDVDAGTNKILFASSAMSGIESLYVQKNVSAS